MELVAIYWALVVIVAGDVERVGTFPNQVQCELAAKAIRENSAISAEAMCFNVVDN